MKHPFLLYFIILGLALAAKTVHSAETNGQQKANGTNFDDNLSLRYEPRAVPPGQDQLQGNWGPTNGGVALSLTFDKAVYQQGEPITAIVAFHNATNRPIAYMVSVGGAPLASLVITNEATGALIQGKPLHPYFGSAFLVSLEPGWQNVYDLRLDRYFSLGPGKYAATAKARAGAFPGLLPSSIAHLTIKEKASQEH